MTSKASVDKAPSPALRAASPRGRGDYWLFNLGAEVYAWFTSSEAWRASCARMAGLLADLDAPKIADLGCGPGVSTFELARRLPTAHLVGVDVAPRMLQQARRTALHERARVTWVQADAAALPFKQGSLDACTGHSFLYLVANRAAVLSEVRRVLRPRGRLVLMEPNETPATVAKTLRVSHDPRHLVSISLWRPFSRFHGRFTAASLAATLADAGFVNCDAADTFGGLGLLAHAEAPA
jgi:SAM-dependent methyltransferase